ncbi:lysosomal cholesterol signaling protein-like isoform X2 [Saccostrea echinata]|uniref:lysosomal cholesterol signaling protein-like isoform X2 n=1 Tax=Saccostrea echinata TaxID=191078 RepID=UPI002A7EC798|nr:lysosomal cholesterol signaling protein-like isoform X2 [Saccostrea echinata]
MEKNSTNLTSSSQGGAVSIENLYPAIVQCFVIILSGYIAARLNCITAVQGKGIGTFVSKFCLPALLFKNMCILNFADVNWIFLLCILIAKSVIFFLVMILCLLIKRPRNYGIAGLFAIFATQSNDFALGFPLLQALYEDSHPEYLKYIYLIAPISVVFLNPIGFILLEIQQHKERELEKSTHEIKGQGSCMPLSIGLHVIKGVITNPIVFMTFIGIIGNFVFQRNLPDFLSDILDVFGNAYAASALFYLGLGMVGKVTGQISLAMVVPLLLIGAKGLLMPLVTWMVVGGIERISDVSNSTSDAMFGFLYGTFPTAPSVFLYASHYATGMDTVAFGMVAGTFLAAPLMFVSARMLSVVVVSEMDYKDLLLKTSTDISIISMVACVWVLIIMFGSKRFKRIPHQFLVCLILSHFISCLGMVIYGYKDCSQEMQSWKHYVEFTMILAGTLATRCWTMVIAITLYLIHCRSLCFVLRFRFWLYFLGFGAAMLSTGVLYLSGKHHMHDEIDPSFHYGTDQTILSVLFILFCCVVTIICLVLKQRNGRDYKLLATEEPDVEQSIKVAKIKSKGKKVNSRVTKPRVGNCQVQVHGENSTNRSPPYRGSCNDCDQGCAGGLGESHSEVRTRNPQNIQVEENIEDIVPFPSESSSLLSDSSESSAESRPYLTRSTEELTCKYGACSSEQKRRCMGRLRAYQASVINVAMGDEGVRFNQPRRCPRDEYQTNRFLILLVLLLLSMFIGLFLCTWRLFNKTISGIYVEMEFLDAVFNYGQGFIILAIFGFDTKYIFLPFIRSLTSNVRLKWLKLMCLRWRRLVYGVEVVQIPERGDLDEETIHLCEQFVKYHMENCSKKIVKDHKYNFRQYKDVFTGMDMCDWLLEVGLVHDRGEAVNYGRTLLIGRVIAHVKNEHHFHDLSYFYCFLDDEESVLKSITEDS